MAFDISVRSNIKDIQKALNGLAQNQIPFATAAALTSLAKLVQLGEVDQIRKTFKTPSPFTANSVRVIPARKNTLTATVFVMDKAAEYIEPYEDGGVHKINSRALLNPKDIKLNQYGQLRKGTIAALKGRPDIYIGPVKTAKGIVNGVWQRVTSAKRTAPLLNKKGKRLRGLNKATVGPDGKQQGHLKLLLRFGDALPVKQHLGYEARAQAIVKANFNAEFGKALVKAMATAK